MKFASGLARVGWDILSDEDFANEVTKAFVQWRQAEV